MSCEPYPEHVDLCFHEVVNSLTIDQREVVLMDELALVKEFLSSLVAPLGVEALSDQTCEFCPANYNTFIFQGVQWQTTLSNFNILLRTVCLVKESTMMLSFCGRIRSEIGMWSWRCAMMWVYVVEKGRSRMRHWKTNRGLACDFQSMCYHTHLWQ